MYLNNTNLYESNKFKLTPVNLVLAHLFVLVATLWDPPLLSPAINRTQRKWLIFQTFNWSQIISMQRTSLCIKINFWYNPIINFVWKLSWINNFFNDSFTVLRPLKNWVVYRLHVVEIAVLTTEIAHWQPNPFTHVQDKSVQEDEVCDSQHFVCRVKFNLL